MSNNSKFKDSLSEIERIKQKCAALRTTPIQFNTSNQKTDIPHRSSSKKDHLNQINAVSFLSEKINKKNSRNSSISSEENNQKAHKKPYNYNNEPNDEFINGFEMQIKSLLKQNEHTNSVLAIKQKENQVFKTNIFNLNCKIKELESKAELFENENKHFQRLLVEKEVENEAWKNEYFKSEEQNLKMTSLEQKTIEYEELIDELKEKIECLAYENNELKKFNNESEITQRLNEKEDNLKNLHEKVSELMKTNYDLSQMVSLQIDKVI